MKLTSDQDALLERLLSADRAYRTARLDEYERIRREADERILARKIIRDRLVAEAVLAGIPKRQIGMRGLSTTDSTTVKEAVAHGMTLLEPELPTTPEVKQDEQITIDGDVLTVTLAKSDYARYKGLIDGEGGESHGFTVDGERVMPVGADDEETFGHPVVRVVMAADGTWRKRVLEAAKAAAAR